MDDSADSQRNDEYGAIRNIDPHNPDGDDESASSSDDEATVPRGMGRPGKFQWALICTSIVSTYLIVMVLSASFGLSGLVGHILGAVVSGVAMVFSLSTFARV